MSIRAIDNHSSKVSQSCSTSKSSPNSPTFPRSRAFASHVLGKREWRFQDGACHAYSSKESRSRKPSASQNHTLSIKYYQDPRSLPSQHRSAAHINKIMNCFQLEWHGNAHQTAYPGTAVPCTTPPRVGTTKKEAGHPEPAINGQRDLLRQHPSALHLPHLPELPTHDLT